VRAEVSLDPNKLMAELNRSSTRWISWFFKRSKTSETEYQKTHKERPSNEIQTTLNLLFKEKEHGLYTQD
jgi:hypothetical protein